MSVWLSMFKLGIKNAQDLKKFMQAHGVAFNKRLGQNFLMNANVLEKIIAAADVDNCGVLEVGAGLGNLTELLVKRAKKVVALEIDSGLFQILKSRFAGVSGLVLLNSDVLKTNLRSLFESEFDGMPVKICANLPYYLTSNFVAGVLQQQLKLESLTLMVQKEAGCRLCAAPGCKNCGAISSLVSYYSTAKILFDVGRFNFYPAPKVDSCVVNLNLEKKQVGLKETEEANFFKFVRVAFSQRRKVLVSPVAAAFKLDKSVLKQTLVSLGLSASVRAQELSLAQLVALYNKIFV